MSNDNETKAMRILKWKEGSAGMETEQMFGLATSGDIT